MRLVPRADRAQLRDRDLPFREYFEEKRLECLVGAIHFIDQQDRRRVAGNGIEQRLIRLRSCA